MRRFVLGILWCGLFLGGADIVMGQERVEITRGHVKPLTTALASVRGSGGEGALTRAERARRVIEGDLARTGLFRMLSRIEFLSDPGVEEAVKFRVWRILDAEVLVTGSWSEEGGKAKLRIRGWDVFRAREVVDGTWEGDVDDGVSRRLGHLAANELYEGFTGEEGYFDSRLAYVSETGPKDARVKRLALMDQDGGGVRYLTEADEGALVLTPRFDPSGARLAYVSYEPGEPPRIYLYDLESGEKSRLGEFPGMTYAPRFSPDGGKLVMSLEESGESNLYEFDVKTRKFRELTSEAAISTSPGYSPSGDRIVYESDKVGEQQLYVMDLETRESERISFGDGSYGTPVWSPRGDFVAFTKVRRGRFLIGVMRPDGSGERILTSGYHNEGPTWSPGGRVLAFFRDTPGEYGGPHLWTVDVTGRNEREVLTGTFASDPSWGRASAKLKIIKVRVDG